MARLPTLKHEGIEYISCRELSRYLHQIRECLNEDPQYYAHDPDELIETLLIELGTRDE